ncbi:transposase [Tomitella gaofuii]|uniref:transposase n=1 Tax=Tomitella gaofuii TaxID=2760083 RepID=UPI0015FB2C5F|nr:transposase [Tomitella gaofuii]
MSEQRRRYGHFDAEVRAAAVESVRRLRPHVGSAEAACRVVAEQLGCSISSIRSWLREAGGIGDVEDAAREAELREQLRIAAEMNRELAEHARGSRR